MADIFPRGTDVPSQTPLFWVQQKDRYLRQLLIKDIQDVTQRKLVVYYTDCGSNAQIDPFDTKYIQEMLVAAGSNEIDLLLETNGGGTDATENIVSLLLKSAPGFRTIVPQRAKSNGTLIALASSEVVMGDPSELGPIDPNLVIGGQTVPCTFIVNATNPDPIIFQYAESAIKQTQKLATAVLKSGMLAGKSDAQVDGVVQALSTRQQYHSHGSVIDHIEGTALGLKIKHLPPVDALWCKFWLLRCMYDFDARMAGYSKIYECDKASQCLVQQQPGP